MVSFSVMTLLQGVTSFNAENCVHHNRGAQPKIGEFFLKLPPSLTDEDLPVDGQNGVYLSLRNVHRMSGH